MNNWRSDKPARGIEVEVSFVDSTTGRSFIRENGEWDNKGQILAWRSLPKLYNMDEILMNLDKLESEVRKKKEG